MIRFMKHYVTDGTIKARVFYSGIHLQDGTVGITIYAKDYSRSLGKIFKHQYINETDLRIDYFDEGHVTITKNDPLYDAAFARWKKNCAF